MQYTAATLLALASAVSAHTTLFGVSVNGVDQGDGRSKYIRSPPNNNPVKDLSKPDLVCNVNGGKAVGSFVSAAAGDKLTFEWYHDNRGDDIIAASHLGPVITYIAPYTEGNGAEAIWTKIAEDGYDGSQWAVQKLIANKGKNDFTLPSALKAGKYLVRQEIIALHESDTTFDVNSARGAQFYPTCVQFDVTGSGSAVPSENFNFNTGYTYADPGIHFNLYGSFTSYTIPGPKVDASLTSGSGSSPAPVSSVAAPAPTSAAATSAAATSAAATVAPTTAPTTVATPAAPTTLSTAVRPTVVAPSSSVAAAPTKKPCSSRRRRNVQH